MSREVMKRCRPHVAMKRISFIQRLKMFKIHQALCQIMHDRKNRMLELGVYRQQKLPHLKKCIYLSFKWITYTAEKKNVQNLFLF